MSSQLPKPYYLFKQHLLFPGTAHNISCPRCGNRRINQRSDELIDPTTGRRVYPPEAMIMTFLMTGFAAAMLIIVGDWLVWVGALLEAVVLYGAFVRLPAAFRAREMQIFHFQCAKCTTEWSTSLL